MPIKVRAPDGTLVNFPDGMSQGDIARVMRQNYPPSTPIKQAAPKASPEAIKRNKYLDEYAASQKRQLDETLRVSKLPGVTTSMRENASGRIEEYRKTLADIANEKDYMQRTGTLVPERSFGAAALDQLKGFGAGAVRTVAGIPSLLGAVGIEGPGKAAEQAGERFIERNLAPDESDAAKFATFAKQGRRLSEVAGSVAPAFATRGVSRAGMAVAGPRAVPAIARVEQTAQLALGAGPGAQQQRQAIEQYEQEKGTSVNPVVSAFAQALGAAIGATEVLTLDAMMARVPSSMRGSMTAKLAGLAERVQVGGMSPKAAAAEARALVADVQKTARGRLGVAAFEEGTQEAGAQLAQNVVERGLYNAEKDITEGVEENFTYGAIAGGGLRGGVELANVLGKRAADNRKKAFEQTSAANEPLEEFDVNVGSYEDPSQLTRQKIQRISEPDENGDVFARRADGTIYQTSLKELYRMRAPTEGIRAVPIPDTLSAPALTQRLTGALGNAEPDSDMQSYINSVTTTLNNNMALGTPEKTDTYLQKQQNGLRRARLSEDAKIARMLVLDEAVKLNNEYVGLVTAPPEGAAPEGIAPSVDQAPSTETSAPLSDEAIQSQIDTMRGMREQRAAALNAIASDPNYLDKVETFEALMVQNGFDAPTTVEVASLYDAMRAESDAETAAGEEEGASKRQRIVDRANIIERVLYDDRISADKKEERINAKMKAKDLGPLSRYELERIAGVQAANDVFGPEGEYTERRQALFDQVVADPTITDKYRGYAEALDQFPELGDPTVDEIRILRGDAAPLEAQIAPSAEPITTTQLPAEPGGLPEEGITSGQLEGEILRDKPKRDADARAAINEQIKVEQAKLDEAQRTAIGESADQIAISERIAVEQAKLDAEPHKGTPVARRAINAIKALTEPYKSTPAARRAINNIKALEAERAALGEAPVTEEVVQEPVQEEAPIVEAPIAEAAPVAEEVVQEPVQEEALAPATEQPAPTATKQTINNPEEDISPAEERLEADPTTIEGAFPASLNRPRAEAIGFAADLDRRVKSMSSRVRRRLEGKYKTAYDYSRALSAAYGVTKLPADLDVARKFELLESRKIGGQMRLNRWYLQPIEDKVVELGVDPDDAAMYLWARSAPARNALVRERTGMENGSGMSDAQAQVKLDELELEGLGPKLREVAKLHDALVDYMGNQRVKAGLLSKADWKAWRKAQPFYTPLKGYALDGDMQVDGEPNPHSDAERGIAKKNGTRIREALTTRGRKSIPFNPLYNLMADAQFAIARIEQNKVKEAFLNNILSDPKSHEDLVTVYTPKKKTHASGLVTLPKIGPAGPVDMNQLAAQPDANLMIVKKDGEPYYVEFTETPAGNALYRLFGNMTPKQVNQFFRGVDFQVDGKSYHIPGAIEVANTLKSFKTRFSPVFTFLISPLRDFKEAVATAYVAQKFKGGPAEGTKLGKQTARYIRDLKGMGTISNYLRGKDPTTAEGELNALLFDQFLEDGGAVGHAQVMESERYAQDVARNIKRYAALKRGNPAAAALKAKDMLAGGLDHVAQLFDLHARFATYRAALEEGISREDASALALDSTLDMTRRGELGPVLDSWSFFFSPTVGGARKLISQGRYSALARKLFTRLVMGGMLLYLFNRFGPGAGDDDEDGRPNILEVNNATAQTRVIFRYDSGINDYVAVPTAFGLGFFNYVGGQIMATLLGDIQPMEGATNIVGGFVSLASPIKTEGTEGLTGIVNFAVPDTGQWGYDLIVNRNAFGSPIYKEQEYSTLPKSELGREDTGEVWKFIARGMNSLFRGTDTVESVGSAQPEQYRYVAQQLLGGAYTFSRDIVEAVSGEAKPDQTTVQRIPLVKSLFGKGGEYVPMSKFYEDYNTLRSIHNTYKKSDEEPEAWAENEAAFPVQADTRVMDAFDTALSEIQSINKKYRAGEYASAEDKYDALNDVYKAFNQTYSEVKKEK
jgi:hypothetical protein